MMLFRRRLFWKIYATLLASLVAVAVLMGGLWWLLGETPQERLGSLQIHLTNELIPAEDRPPGAIEASIRRLGDEIGADISVYGSDGRLIAAQGRPVILRDEATPFQRRFVMRIDLADGRAVMARLRPPGSSPGFRILTLVAIVVGGVGLAAFPMTARLTRRLEALRSGMALWGSGETTARVDSRGSDEVALVARTFNTAAERLDHLLASQRALLTNASHELRSPLARLRIAIELWLEEPASAIHTEIVRNLAEIDVLVEEILLSSRLDHPSSSLGRQEAVDLLGLAAEEAARVGASVEGVATEVDGSPRLLRRLLRNLLENAVRHGAPPVHVAISQERSAACIVVTDCGKGIARDEQERVFEPFYRPQGRGEESGGWGLGLSLVRQIAGRHGGRVQCDQAEDGGSRFTVHLALRASSQIDEPRSGHVLASPRERPDRINPTRPKGAEI